MSWKSLLPRTITEAGLRYDPNREVLLIPYRTPSGDLFRWRWRKHDKEWWGFGDNMLPYGLETLCNPLRASRSTLCVCEGESDTLTLREVLRGLTDRGWEQWIYVIGCPGAQNWNYDWSKYVTPFDHVVILGDGDEAGLRFVERTRSMIEGSIGWTMADSMDVRSVIQEIGPDELLGEIRYNVELVDLFTQ